MLRNCVILLFLWECLAQSPDDVTPVERDNPELVLGMGWGLFAVIVVAVVAAMATLLSVLCMAPSKVPIVGLVGVVVTVVFFIILASCPTFEEQAEQDRKNVKIDDTARYRTAIVVLAAIGLLAGIVLCVAFLFSTQPSLVPRPIRGAQTHRKYKNAIAESVY